MLIATQWGYTAQAIQPFYGETPLSRLGSATIIDRDDYGFGVSRGELSLSIQPTESSDTAYELAAAVRDEDWGDEQRTWTIEAGHTVLNIE